MGTRHNKKVDTYSNNKTWNTKPTSLPDLAKSYGRRASHNDKITSGVTTETLARRKGKTWGHR